jgi:hypothetical protein
MDARRFHRCPTAMPRSVTLNTQFGPL